MKAPVFRLGFSIWANDFGDAIRVGLVMTDMLDRFISASALREAVKARCRAGARRETISRLIACYVPANIDAKCDCGRDRLPVELIPTHRRAAFFEALHRLPSTPSFATEESTLSPVQSRPQLRSH
jgi:hypothetical protein